MTTPNTSSIRKLIDVAAIFAVLDAEKHLMHGTLVTALGGYYDDELLTSQDLPEPGPLAVANCEHIGRCAMGSLLYASGEIAYRELTLMGGDAREWPLRPVRALYNAYGLQRYHAQEIIDANDLQDGEDEPSITARRQRVKERVRQLAEQQLTNPATDLHESSVTEQLAAGWFDEGALSLDDRLEQLGLPSTFDPDFS